MAKRLTKFLNVVLFLLFIGGSLVFPAVHMLHGCDDDCCGDDHPATHQHTSSHQHKTHDADHCPICQLVLMPAVNAAPPPAVAPNIEPVLFGHIDNRAEEIFISFFWRDATQARAPPVA